MLGTRSQRGFFTAATLLAPDLDKLGFYGKLAVEGRRLFRDSDFRDCYSTIGRPSASPSLVACARLLQHYEGISDEEVIERLRFDLRWKIALDLELNSIAPPFVKSTFQAFRVRLVLHAKEGLAFEKIVRKARDAGLLPKKLCMALDSSPVRGRGAVKDTFNLLSDAVCAVVRAIAVKRGKPEAEVAAAIGVERHLAPSIKGTEPVEWDDEAAVSTFLGGILEDCDKTVAAARKAKCATNEVELLEKVISQDVDRPDGGLPSIRDGVAKDRIVSTTDPDMRHGHKSSGKGYTGHKAHIAVEVESGIITAIDVTAPGVPDGAQVGSLIETTEALTGHLVETALGDTAYSSRTAVEQAAQAEVDLETKMPSPPEGKFGPSDFTVSGDGTTAVCPNEHKSTTASSPTTLGTKHRWSAKLCGPCPLRDKCTNSAKGRSLLVPPDFHDKRRREREARSPEGRERLKKRVAVEHAIGRLKHLGAGAARYFGRAKTKAQWLWTGAVGNLVTIWAATARAVAPEVA